MSGQRTESWSRRKFLQGLTLAGTAGFLRLQREAVAGEPPPETTRLKIADLERGICVAPQYVAEDLLRGEGFAELQYVRKQTQGERLRAVATGEAHMIVTFVSSLVSRLDAGDPLVFLAAPTWDASSSSERSACARSGTSGEDGGDCPGRIA